MSSNTRRNPAELLATLVECIEDMNSQVSEMNDASLERLLDSLPAIIAAGSAEMVLSVMLYREIQSRDRGNVVAFPIAKR
ncbi:hypothetical protein [Mesorhizobium sp. 131-3-5]|uniref:hypothetical protein n=1 Tax=Mesorhizobium sp. 131-3-5 TaxID=2744520 RepID=UPI0019281BAA|nr:hypothetical protein [Mesorhizobium sp. 131-3-5]